MDRLRIEGLTVDCIVGVYRHERTSPQPLALDVDLFFDAEPGALRENVGATLDYEAIAAQLTFLLRTCRFRLLETAAHALARYLLAPPPPDESHPRVERVRLRLTKAGALRGLAIPSLEIERDAAWCVLPREEKVFGTVDIVHETRDAGIYRLNVRPGGTIPLHFHRTMQEAEMVLTDGLLCQRKPARVGSVRRWPRGAAHLYENPTARWQSLLCVDQPRFLESDEVPVEGEPADVPAETTWGSFVEDGG